MANEMKGGKRVVVTGASRGIGRETALALGRMGGDLSLVVRDAGRGHAVADEVRAIGGGGDVDVFIADLSSMTDIRRVAAELLAKHDRVDVLVNNAGVLLMDRQITKDGYEATFATNHLGYFLLTELLLDAVKKAPAGRIVNVSSDAHYSGSMRFDDSMGAKRYSGVAAYSSSKLANILFTSELARRLEGTSVTTNALHPGVVASGFAHNNKGLVGFLAKIGAPFLMSPVKGARRAPTSPATRRPRAPRAATSAGAQKTPSREARDVSVAKRLWEGERGARRQERALNTMRYEGSSTARRRRPTRYILQATIGCSWNHCTYCDMYRDKTFRVRDLAETLEDLDVAARRPATAGREGLRRRRRRAGAADRSLAADPRARARALFPHLRRVSCYAMARNVLAKTDARAARAARRPGSRCSTSAPSRATTRR